VLAKATTDRLIRNSGEARISLRESLVLDPESPRLVAADATKPPEFALAKGEVSIGAAAGNDLVIQHTSVSRRHAKIMLERGGIRVVDLQSTNGTFVNGARIAGSAVARHGDEIRFGGARYVLRDGPSLAGATSLNRRMRPATLAGIIALLFAGAFALTEYLVNWNRMEQVAERSAPATTRNPPVEAIAPGARSEEGGHEATPSAADNAWLGPLNYYRSMAGLNKVAADAALSVGDAAHARYLAKNYGERLESSTLGAEAHEEDPSNRWYTAAGAKAAAGSDVTEGFHSDGAAWLEPRDAIDGWVSIPFHRLWILNPNLHRAGYAQYCERGLCVAALDLISGADPISMSRQLPKPIEFPPDAGVVKMGSADEEWPNPLSACPGYSLPMGLPVTLQLGAAVDARLSAYSLTRAGNSSALEACGFDANSYTNPDPQQQARAREVLHDFGAVVVIPRAPLAAGRYTVSITASGHQYTWSFTISE